MIENLVKSLFEKIDKLKGKKLTIHPLNNIKI